MEIVSLERFHCFSNEASVLALNRLVEAHSVLMPHQIAVATGCNLDEAMSLLLHLYVLSVASPKTIVYHILDETDPPVSILLRDLKEGPPELPFICPVCNQEVDSYDELNFDFVFILNTKTSFRV